MIPAWLREADRRWSWTVALAIGLFVASDVHPLSWTTILERARGLDVQYNDVYSELHGRPFAYCDSYADQRKEALASVEALDTSLLQSLRVYNSRMIAHYAEDCRLPWRPYANAARFQAFFAQSYVLYFFVTTFGWSEVYLGLAAIAVAWAGLVAFALACVWCWRSALAPVAGFTIASILLSASFAASLGLTLPAFPAVLVVPGDALYPLVTVLLVTAIMTVVPAGWRALRHPAYWLLPAACAAHGWLYVFVDPPVARMYVWVALGLAAVVTLVGRDWARTSCVVLAAAAFGVVWHWYGIAAREMYAVISGYDHLASEAFAPFMMYMGLLERPSPLGLFYMDEVFSWGYSQDPVVGVVAPHLTAHYSFGDVGGTLFREALWSHPSVVVDAVVRRLLVQLFYRPLWYDWVVRVDWIYTVSVLGVVVISAIAVLVRRWWLPLILISLAILVNQFALDTLMTLVHVHPRWNRLGVLLMFGTAPLYLFVLARLLRSESLGRRFRMALSGRTARVTVVTAIGLVVVGGAHARTLLADERENLAIWMPAMNPPDGLIDIEGLLARLDARRSNDGDPDGALAMWTASLLFLYEHRYPFSAVTPPQTTALLLRRELGEGEIGYAAGPPVKVDGCWRLEGDPDAPYVYLLATVPQTDPAEARLVVEGVLEAGGLTVGLQSRGSWVETHNVTGPGPFEVVIEPAAERPLDIVIANNQPAGTLTNACVQRIGWMGAADEPGPLVTRDQVRARREVYFRQALAAAPGNHHFPFYARFLDIRGWADFLVDAVQRFPQSPHVPGALAALWHFGPEASVDAAGASRLYRIALARQFDQALGGFLERHGHRNPLYSEAPVLAETAGEVETQQLRNGEGRRVARLRLPPGAEVVLSPHLTWSSDYVQVLAYLHLLDGAATVALDLRGSDRRDGVATPLSVEPTAGRYVRLSEATRPGDTGFALRLRAGVRGAVLDVADYYPILHSPEGYYPSPFGPRHEETP